MRLLPAGLAAILAAALAVALLNPTSVRRPAPPLPAKALVGAPTTLGALRGQPALVDFFASWCDPCAAEAPTLRRAAAAVAGRARVVAVDWTDSRSYGIAFVRRYHWRFPILADPNGDTGYRYGIHTLPAAFVIDGRGRIVQKLLGPQTERALVRALDQARSD